MKTKTVITFFGTILCAIGSVLMTANSIHPVPHISRNGLIIFLVGLAIILISFIPLRPRQKF